MRKVKLQVQISVDGYIAGTAGEMDWMQWDWDRALKKYVSEITDPVDTIILGKNLALGFIPTWASMYSNPETADDFARKMVETDKVVFTKTLERSEWENTVLAKGELAVEIKKLKDQPGGDIIVYGGGTFVSSLIREGLIDEFHLFVNPAALGEGMSIFQKRTNLKLVKFIGFDCGIVLLCYKPA